MSNAGTQEEKRSRKAAPPNLQPRMSSGCLVALAIYLGACAAVYAASKWTGALVLGSLALLVLVGIVGRLLYGAALLIAVRRKWAPRGVRCLLVFSNSPAWESYVRANWLPTLGDAAVVLNWSDRASWRSTLAVRVFRHFCGERHNFNPAVVVFRGLRQPRVFRFFYAFQEVKKGRSQYLERLEAQMFNALGLEKAA